MVKTTKAQRQALKRYHTRMIDDFCANLKLGARWPMPPTYRQFRKTVQPYYDGSGCILVPWCGMWVGIETDGYAHT